jgi:hypothetical protein
MQGSAVGRENGRSFHSTEYRNIFISASLDTFSFVLPTVVDIITDMDMIMLYCIR